MPILDDHGRLFGKINLIDAAVGVFLLVLIPLGYGAWLLFKTPPPVFTGITPGFVEPGVLYQPVIVNGQHLRPFFRAYVANEQAAYLFESTERVEVRLPKLEPGTYDLVFFDDAVEVGRLTNAIAVGVRPVVKPVVTTVTVQPAGRPNDAVQLNLMGTGLDGPYVAFLGEHKALSQVGSPAKMEVRLPVLPPGIYDLGLYGPRVPKAGSTPPGGAADEESTQGRELVLQQPKALTVADLEVVFRAVQRPEIAEAVKRTLAADARQQPTTARAVVVSCDVTDEVTGTGYIERKDGKLDVLKLVLRMAAVRTPAGWQHNGWMIRAGQAFRLETPDYSFDGDILSVRIAGERR